MPSSHHFTFSSTYISRPSTPALPPAPHFCTPPPPPPPQFQFSTLTLLHLLLTFYSILLLLLLYYMVRSFISPHHSTSSYPRLPIPLSLFLFSLFLLHQHSHTHSVYIHSTYHPLDTRERSRTEERESRVKD